MATHSCILAWIIPWTEEPGGYSCGVTKSRTRLSTQTNLKATYCYKRKAKRSYHSAHSVALLTWNKTKVSIHATGIVTRFRCHRLREGPFSQSDSLVTVQVHLISFIALITSYKSFVCYLRFPLPPPEHKKRNGTVYFIDDYLSGTSTMPSTQKCSINSCF